MIKGFFNFSGAFLIILLLFTGVFAGFRPIKDLKPTVILISLDGFRYDYLKLHKPPTLAKLAAKGVQARWLIPSFPTKTFPNHYTIATGLYPENHGIIGNNIYDKEFNAVFSLNKREEVQNPRWWFGEPIWVTAEKQGQRAASFFFPGTETAIAGVRPSFWREYDGNVSNEERVDQILKWFDLPANERPTIYTLYFSDTDDTGHAYSPDSKELEQAIKKVDADLKRLYDGLNKRKIGNKVNIIVISDHGMANVLPENYVLLDDFFDFDLTDKILWTGEIVQIFPKIGNEEKILSGLKTVNGANCWQKAEIPARLRFQNSSRIAPIVCSAEEGFYMTDRQRLKERQQRDDWGQIRGAHGYDNRYQSMMATFIAHGEAFKKGYVAEPFENVHIYNLMCHILNLTPASNDGNFSVVSDLLKNTHKRKSSFRKDLDHGDFRRD